MRLRIIHKAGYHYDTPAAASRTQARLLPISNTRQQVQSTSVECDPSGWKQSFTDYWGTPTVTVHVLEKHETLALVGTAVVDIEEAPTPAPPARLTWDDLPSGKVRDRFTELLVVDADALPAELADAVDRARTDAPTPSAFADAVAQLVGPQADYLVTALRRHGVPARLVSGIVLPSEGFEVGDTVDVPPRMWVEFWDAAWQGIDPATQGRCGLGHIDMAFGRERNDIRPLCGVYSGKGSSTPYQQITVKRLG